TNTPVTEPVWGSNCSVWSCGRVLVWERLVVSATLGSNTARTSTTCACATCGSRRPRSISRVFCNASRIASSSDSARTRAVADEGSAGGWAPVDALCWAKDCWAREAGALERGGTQHTLNTVQTTSPVCHQRLWCLRIL